MLMGHTRLPCVQGTAGGTCVWKHIQCGKGLRCREGESVSLSAKPAVVRPAEVPSPQGWARKVFKEWNGTHRSGAYARGAVCAPWGGAEERRCPNPTRLDSAGLSAQQPLKHTAHPAAPSRSTASSLARDGMQSDSRGVGDCYCSAEPPWAVARVPPKAASARRKALLPQERFLPTATTRPPCPSPWRLPNKQRRRRRSTSSTSSTSGKH
jgi:hypothetical protein